MSGEEFVLSMVAMVMASVVIVVSITKVTGLIKSWINRNQHSYDDEAFDRLAQAFLKHKKQIEQRVHTLERASGDAAKMETPASGTIDYPELEEPHGESTLHNDLESKRRVR